MSIRAEHPVHELASHLNPQSREILRFILEWLVDDDDRIAALEALDLAVFIDATTSTVNGLTDQVFLLEQANLDQRLSAVEQALQALSHRVASYVITVPDTTKDPTTMAFQILDSDNTKIASVSYLDALGFPTTDAGASVVFASADPTVLTIDAASGAIAPLKPGVTQIQATVTDAAGAAVTGVPADVDVIAGAAASFTVGIS